MLSAARVLEFVIVVTLIEGAALGAYRRATGRGVPLRELVAFLGAGLSLLVAARLAVGGAPVAALAGALLLALAMHLWLVTLRWQR